MRPPGCSSSRSRDRVRGVGRAARARAVEGLGGVERRPRQCHGKLPRVILQHCSTAVCQRGQRSSPEGRQRHTTARQRPPNLASQARLHLLHQGVAQLMQPRHRSVEQLPVLHRGSSGQPVNGGRWGSNNPAASSF
jgi:hypothetical protein